MKKLKVSLMSLSIVAALALAMPTVVLADDDGGPQGTTKSTTPAANMHSTECSCD